MAPWRQSQPRPDGVVVEAGNHVLAVDCEMCLTCQGAIMRLECAALKVV